MNESPLQKLFDLVEFDQQMLALEKSIKDIREEFDNHLKERDTCKEGVERAIENKKEKRKEVDKRELEMKALDEKIKSARVRVDAARNQREYDSANKELEELNKTQAKLEEELLKAWKDFEQAEQFEKERKSFCDEQLAKLSVVITDDETKLKGLRDQLTKQKKERSEKMKNIPEDLLEKYTIMYNRVENPVVPVSQSSCSACFYSIPQQNLHNIRRGKLVQCKDCFRFLYISEAQDQ